jgi:hypothetical protein
MSTAESFASLILALLVVPCLGQKLASPTSIGQFSLRSTSPTNPQSVSSPTASTLPIPKSGKFQHGETITVSYDRFKNYTFANIDPMMHLKVLSTDHDLRSLDFSAFYVCPGHKLRPPRDVTFHFMAQSPNSWYRDHLRSLVLLVDGKRLDLGNADWDRGDVVSGMAEESISVDLPLRKFILIVNAKQVEGQLGGTEFVLSDENLEALRDLASRMISVSAV